MLQNSLEIRLLTHFLEKCKTDLGVIDRHIARSENGTFKVVENLGHIDPKECEVPPN